MTWKMYRRHDGTHDLDTREHDRRVSASKSAKRWSKISSKISCGRLPGVNGITGISGFVAFSLPVLDERTDSPQLFREASLASWSLKRIVGAYGRRETRDVGYLQRGWLRWIPGLGWSESRCEISIVSGGCCATRPRGPQIIPTTHTAT